MQVNTTLQTLDLSFNDLIGDEGAKAIAAALQVIAHSSFSLLDPDFSVFVAFVISVQYPFHAVFYWFLICAIRRRTSLCESWIFMKPELVQMALRQLPTLSRYLRVPVFNPFSFRFFTCTGVRSQYVDTHFFQCSFSSLLFENLAPILSQSNLSQMYSGS